MIDTEKEIDLKNSNDRVKAVVLLSGGLDSALAARMVMEQGIEVHCLRDLTRGGFATTLVEITESSGLHISVDESQVPIRDDVRGACEMLGLNPMYVANEGRFVAFVPASDAHRTSEILSDCFPDLNPTVVGRVTDQESGLVTMKGIVGAERVIDMLSGEQLPRIC